MSESLKISCLGPAGTFSHQALRKHFNDGVPMLHDSLEDVMECVVHGECDFGLAPFDNSNSSGVVKAQLALLAHRRQLYVTSLHPLHIRLQFYCHGRVLANIREIRSIDVVFRQAEDWLAQNVPTAKPVKFPSTASAVLSLVDSGSSEIAAIGGQEVARVPILAKDIQTEPNVTTFCRIQKEAPDWEKADYVLVALDPFEESLFKALMNYAADFGCAIGANWIIDDHCQHVGVFEIKKDLPTARLHDLCSVVERRLAKTFLLGGYTGKSFTRLSLEKYGIL